MQITDKKKRVIYEGRDGFVAVFRSITKNGQEMINVDCYSSPKSFDMERVNAALVRAATLPIGKGYDVVFYQDIDDIVFGKGVALKKDSIKFVIAVVETPGLSNHFTFFTNMAPNTNAGESYFHGVSQKLLESIHAVKPPAIKPSDDEDYDDDDEYTNEYESDEEDEFSPEVSDEVYTLYTCDFLFNMFGDQILSVVCSSKNEYNEFVSMLRDLGIITVPSLNAEGWNDVMKYIMFDVGRNTAYAACYPPKSVDVVLPVSDFLRKIQKNVGELLNVH